MHVTALQPADDAGWSARRLRIAPQTLLRLTLLTLCVTSVLNFSLSGGDVRNAPILLNDLGVGFTVLVGVFLVAQTRSLWLDDVTFAALFFSCVGAISTLSAIPRFGLNAMEFAVSIGYLARWVLYLGVYVVVINWVRARDANRVYGTLEAAILIFAAFGIFQSFFLPDFGLMVYPDSRLYKEMDPQGHRLVSTALDPNLAAALIMTVLLVQLGKISTGARVAMWKPALLVVAVVLTVSRSGMLAVAVGGLVILAARGISRRLLRFALPLGLVMLALLPRLIELGSKHSRFSVSDDSAISRLVGWARAVETFLDHPWIGIGFNTYGYVQQRRGGAELFGASSYSVDGGLLFIAVLTGVIGLAAYAIMLWRIVRRCRRTWRLATATPDERGLAVGVAAVTVAMVVNSAFVNSLLTTFIMLPLWVLWGLISVTHAAAANAPQRAA
jgi:O-antigen ligase